MNEKDESDIYDRLKNAGYSLAMALYKADNNGINSIKDLIKKYSGRMFNYIHNNRVSEFILYLEKICASIYIQPPKNTIELLKAENPKIFKGYALAFMMGFMAEKKNDNQKGGLSEQ